MIVSIEIPDDQVRVLKAKAEAQGLSLEAWFEKIVEGEVEPAQADRQGKRAAAASILELQKSVRPDPEGWTIRDYINYGRR